MSKMQDRAAFLTEERRKVAVVAMLPTRTPGQKPRPHNNYREPRRELCRDFRLWPEWREHISRFANMQAQVSARRALADEAAKAVSKVMASSRVTFTVAAGAAAALPIYRKAKQTRAISRIVRELESVVNPRSKHYRQRKRARPL